MCNFHMHRVTLTDQNQTKLDVIDSLKNMPCTKNEGNALKNNRLNIEVGTDFYEKAKRSTVRLNLLRLFEESINTKTPNIGSAFAVFLM
nr:hypothetical protein BCU45_02495 [Vibrio lentus]PMI66718.1 hypothetical protein BCU40_00485 [Vibrio lentus]PMJ55641.1 hypothetical protein BCU20_04165 [Vibrio lentus]